MSEQRASSAAPTELRELVIAFKGAGEMATGIAHRLFRSNLTRIFMMETAHPLAVRRTVSFCEAVYDRRCEVEGVKAGRAEGPDRIPVLWKRGEIPVIVDPAWQSIETLRPHVVIDAVIAKKNLGTRMDDALLTLALGPGFHAGRDVHAVIETNRGHNLGRVIYRGAPEPNTGIPGAIDGIAGERVLRTPRRGRFTPRVSIGDMVKKGQAVADVAGVPVAAGTDGMVRGLLRDGAGVVPGQKAGDIDPRGEDAFYDRISEKARALGGAVLEAVLHRFNI